MATGVCAVSARASRRGGCRCSGGRRERERGEACSSQQKQHWRLMSGASACEHGGKATKIARVGAAFACAPSGRPPCLPLLGVSLMSSDTSVRACLARTARSPPRRSAAGEAGRAVSHGTKASCVILAACHAMSATATYDHFFFHLVV